MRPFQYHQARDVASAALPPEGRFLAGGTTLLDLMKLEVETPSLLVDVTNLPLRQIDRMPDGSLRIGALVTNAACAQHPIVKQTFPVLSQAILAGASPQLRNMATTGGNLLQRTRCWYFRDTSWPCNKREPGSGCSALEGRNRIHAVLGTSPHCIATHPSDMAVALVALDAVVVTTQRRIPLVDFHLVPDDHPDRETVLERGELITAVDIPALPFAGSSRYLKIRDRQEYSFALASAAVALDINGGRIRGARIALGGVGTKPWRCSETERMLVGQPPQDSVFRAAADHALSGARGYADNTFKIELAKRTLMRTLKLVASA